MDVAVSLANASRPPKAGLSIAHHWRTFLLALLSSVVVAAVPFPRAAVAGYAGRPVGEFGPGDRSPLVMPTAVAVDGEGNVFVADGVNDRVVQYNAEGALVTEIRSVGEEKLARPVGVKIDAAGRLWIADTGHGRVLVRKPDGTLDHVFGPQPTPGVPLLDVTDMMPVGDGSACWLVDNDGHRLARSVGRETEPLTLGGRGEGLGRFQYPFAIAQGANGDLFVTDVINGRVQALNKSGQPLFAVASYGVGIGQVYRPKGVACDARGNIWVSDGTLGVVQAFIATGKVIDVLRDEKGEPFRFDVPMGLTFDRQGRLYVVELRPGRVRRLEITEKPSAAKPFTSVRPQITPPQPRACAACHLEWMEPFASGGSSPLMARPVGSPEEPLAARPEMCLSCHDGSVSDSRRRVWLDHGHRVGVQPPASITVPASLPLVGGKLACRTCHSAHGPGGMESADINRTVFLRMPNPAGELCMACHADKTRGPRGGTHPVGGMPWPVPPELVAAGARPAPNPRELTCEVCHTPHGAKENHLLVMGTQSSQLCLNCHARLRPGLWRPEMGHEHPQNPPLTTDAQRKAIKAMETQIGTGDTLICLSCHKVHHGRSGRYILADTLTDSKLCIQCHPERTGMFGTVHDLRTSAATERNRLGQLPSESGPCGACHSFHQFARRPNPQQLDPSGLCATCHVADQCARKATGLPFSHGQTFAAKAVPAGNKLTLFAPDKNNDQKSLACLSCHNPHEVSNRHFLVDRPDSVCANCHQGLVASLNGGHDMTTKPQLKNGRDRSATETGKCGFCHTVHAAVGPVMWAATNTAPKDTDDLCRQCHQADGGPIKQPFRELLHPSGPSTSGKVQAVGGEWPLFDNRFHPAKGGHLACGTCHEVHADAKRSQALLRNLNGKSSTAWCAACHTDMTSIMASAHSEPMMRKRLADGQDGLQTSFCAPCHAVHVPKSGMAAANVAVGISPAPAGSQEYPADMRVCLGCHGQGGKATQVKVTVHPTVPMRNAAAPNTPGFLPLADEKGGLGPEGRITCRTCHVPHGRPPGEGMPVVDPSMVTDEELHDLATLLRPYVAPNLCTGCHGFQGLNYYLYYHFPEKRG